jgi:pyruvate decarboxylase
MLGHDYCQVHEKKYDGVHFLPILKRIVEALEKEPAEYRIPRTDVFTKVEVREILQGIYITNNSADTTSQ